MDQIDSIRFINLSHRTDRLTRTLGWLNELNVPDEKIHRIDAIHIPGRGHIGCIASHIRALESFLKSNDRYTLIMEDDFEPTSKDTFWSSIQSLFSSGILFDAVCPSYNMEVIEETPPEAPFLRRLRSSMTTSSYIIGREYALKLHQCFLEAFYLAQIEESITNTKTHQYTCDVYWHTLMKKDTWYCFYPRIGYQVESFSDIQGHITNYKV